MEQPSTPQSRKEWARQQRKAAYRRAKEQRASDPKQLAFQEAMRERQRAAYQVAKQRRKSSVEHPKQRAADAKTAEAQQLLMQINPSKALA